MAKSQQAKEAMVAGRFKEAISLYRDLVRILPENPGLVMNLGLALHSAGDYEEAVAQFQSVVKMQPQMAAAWYLLGVDLEKLNRPAQAIDPLRRALKIQPQDQAARLELADALFQSDRFLEAATEFGWLAGVNAANTRAWLGLGLSYTSLAEQAFKHLQESFPNSAYAHVLLAKSLVDRSQYPSAYFHYQRALSLDPSLAAAREGIASVYRAIGHADWGQMEDDKARQVPLTPCPAISISCLFAETRYQELLALLKEKKTAESYYWQAITYSELALSAHAKLAELAPSAEIHQLMAVLYDTRELYPRAVQEWRSAIAFQPKNALYKKRLAQSLYGSREWHLTTQVAAEILDAEPDAADVHFLMGDSLLRMQLPEQALIHLKKAVSLLPLSLRAHSSLATVYIRLGRYGDAIPHLEAALPLDHDGTMRYQLAQAYRRLGRIDEVKPVLEEYKQIRKGIEERNVTLKLEDEIPPPSGASPL